VLVAGLIAFPQRASEQVQLRADQPKAFLRMEEKNRRISLDQLNALFRSKGFFAYRPENQHSNLNG
jgi:hypothetical protein